MRRVGVGIIGAGRAGLAHLEALRRLAYADLVAVAVRDGKKAEELTARELKLLQLFYAHPGEVLSRDRLLNEVWGYNYYGTTRTLDQVIVQLRRKLGDSGDEPGHLLTVHGVGYKLVL